jgi:hypothetical protein
MSGYYETRPEIEWYTIPSVAWGNSTKTFNLIGPKGRRGIVYDILVDITADMVGTSTVPEVDVGLTSGSVEYARYRLGSSATSGYTAASTPKRATQEALVTQVQPPVLTDFAGHVALETAFIPKDTAFMITLKAGTGGSPAGTSTTYVGIKWF